jgi:hypothetical protein
MSGPQRRRWCFTIVDMRSAGASCAELAIGAQSPPPPAGIAQLQKLAADAATFQTASCAAFAEASRLRR